RLCRAAIARLYYNSRRRRAPLPQSHTARRRHRLARSRRAAQEAAVSRVAFPFLATNYRGITLDAVGTLVSISRMTDTVGRYTGGWLCDRIRPSQVIL